MRAAALAVAVLGAVLSACSAEQDPAADVAGQASPRASSANVPTAEPGAAPPDASAPSAASPLGGGSALTGRVEALEGRITGFTFRQTATQTIVELAADVLFAFNSAELTPQADAALRRTAELAARSGAGRIQVVGHTDALGDDAYNRALSLRRAEAVARWLSVSGGVSSDRLHTEGRGEDEPVAPNTRPDGQDAPEGRARNRRVVVVMPRA